MVQIIKCSANLLFSRNWKRTKFIKCHVVTVELEETATISSTPSKIQVTVSCSTANIAHNLLNTGHTQVIQGLLMAICMPILMVCNSNVSSFALKILEIAAKFIH